MSRCAALLVTLLAAQSLADDPPRPNPKNPVDYVKWCNEHYVKGMERNAAEAYERALDGLEGWGDENVYVFIDKPPQKWTPEARRALDEWFARNEARVALFVQATRKPACFFELRPNFTPTGLPERKLDDAQARSLAAHAVPNSFPMRDMVMHFVGRARLRLWEGNPAGGAEDVCTALRAVRHLLDQPLQLHCMSGFSLAHRAYGALLDAPVQFAERLDYAAVLDVLRRGDPAPPKPLRQLDFELVQAWDNMQRFLHDSDGDGRYDQYTAYGPENIVTLTTAVQFEATVRDAQALYRRWQQVYSLDDYLEARRLAKSLQPIDWDLQYRKLFAHEDHVDSETQRRHLIERSGPQAGQFDFEWSLLKHWRRLETDRRVVRIILGMHAFKAKRGRWPEDLAQATPGEDVSIRCDPFSGRDFGYRIDDGEPLLYSVGDDGDDDNGHRAARYGLEADGDWVFWPPQAE